METIVNYAKHIMYVEPDSGGSYEIFRGDDKKYYWWACFPGCLPDSLPVGPFESVREAEDSVIEAFDENVL